MNSATAPSRDAGVRRLSEHVRKALIDLPQVARVVVIDADEPQFVVTVRGDWVKESPAVHRALRPLRRSEPPSFHYRTIRESWNDPDPYRATVLLDRR